MPKTKDNDFAYHDIEDPTCPYCDYTYYIEDNTIYCFAHKNGRYNINCRNCGKEFILRTVTSYTYWSYTKEGI